MQRAAGTRAKHICNRPNAFFRVSDAPETPGGAALGLPTLPTSFAASIQRVFAGVDGDGNNKGNPALTLLVALLAISLGSYVPVLTTRVSGKK
jgi:hypothetical protein